MEWEDLIVIAALVLSTTMALAQADTAPPADETPFADQVADLVRQLNDDQVAKRQQAESELVALGAKVLDVLPEESDRLPEETKLRLSRVRGRLEKAAARAATDASSVTLKGEMLLSEAVAEIRQQTNNRLVDFRGQVGTGGGDPKVTLDHEDAPFWEVVDDLFDQADLKLYAYSGQLRTLAFVQREPGEEEATTQPGHSGLFRFEANSIRAFRSLRNPGNSNLVLTLEITWEPRILPIVISQPLEVLAVEDENGESLNVDNSQRVLETSVQNTVASVEIDVPLVLPARDVRQIQSLRGEIAALMPGREATFVFEDIGTARNVEKRRAGVTVTLQRVRKNADVRQIRILVRFDEATGALESHRGWIYGNEAYVIDPQGNRIDNDSFETTRQQIDEIGLAYNFALPENLEGFKFYYKTPAAIVTLPVEYELQDIPLP